MNGDDRRVCLLTGAGGNLGDAFCRALYRTYDIVAVCRERIPAVPSQHEWFIDPLQPQAAIPENDSRVFLVETDLLDDDAVDHVVDIALARFGRIDLLVNAAGYTGAQPSDVIDGDTARTEFAPHFATDVGLPLRLSTTVAQRCWLHDGPANRARNRNIVNVSSRSGASVPPNGHVVYSAAKAALDQLTRGLAGEFTEFGVRVNAIAPNPFPATVSTDNVVRSIIELDRGTASGEIFPVGPANEPSVAAYRRSHTI